MKTLLIGLLALGSFSALSQVHTPRDIFENMKVISKAHTESQGVQEIKTEIEKKYEVECTGDSKLTLGGLARVAEYKAICKGKWFNQKFDLEVKSSFELKEDLNFKVKSFSVNF